MGKENPHGTTESLGPVPYVVLRQMHEYYKNNIGRRLDHPVGHRETTSIWFEMSDDLKNFLADLLKPANNVSGLRIYMCQYDPSLRHKIPPGYQNRMTVGFVATTYNSNTGRHQDDPGSEKDLMLLPVDPYNEGKICPPEICPD